MKKIIPSVFALLLPALLPAQEILVAVAANVQFAMQDIEKPFEQETGIELKSVVSSSGKLTAQIQNGAPFDLFLSADMKYPDTLYALGYAAAKPQVYAYGALVLWTMRDFDLSPGIKILSNPAIKKIALANPQTAPYGAETVRVLKHYQIYERLTPKLVFGESVAQVNQYILSSAAEAGFTAKSVVLSPAMMGKGKWIEIDRAAYTPIAQGIVMLKHGKEKNAKAAQAFYDFVFAAAARKIFTDYGYLLP